MSVLSQRGLSCRQETEPRDKSLCHLGIHLIGLSLARFGISPSTSLVLHSLIHISCVVVAYLTSLVARSNLLYLVSC